MTKHYKPKNIYTLDSLILFLKTYPHKKTDQGFMYTNTYFSVIYINNNTII